MLYRILLVTVLGAAMLCMGCPKQPEPGAGIPPEEQLAPGEGQGGGDAPAEQAPAAGG